MMKRILLTSVYRPFGGSGEGASVGAELFHAQVTRAQGMFSIRQVIRCWGLDYIAHNVSSPTVVLHYPSEKEFIRELKSNAYDYVGINFVVATLHKAKRMAALVRRHAPQAQVILGGYGTVLSDEVLGPISDHICREEGVRFMRRLLGESPDRPIEHPYAPISVPRLFSYQRKDKLAHITGGLGCPNGCDFCCTSHYFKRTYIPFVSSGRELYETMMRMEERACEAGDSLNGFVIIDEDFFLKRRRAREFLDCVREGGRPLSLMGFGSVRGLSNFTSEEIAEMGFDIIWTAFEGRQSGYGKLEGRRLETLYRELKAVGVSLLASMIIGFPYQDRDTVMREFHELMELGPSLTQILIYFAFPGTPFYRRVLEEGMFLPPYRSDPDYRTWDGFTMHMEHPHFEARELEGLQRELYRRDFETLGPSIVRILRVWFDGYRNLRTSGSPLLRKRGEMMRDFVRESLPALTPAMYFGSARERREEARRLYRDIIEELGPLSLRERIFAVATLPLALWTAVSAKLGVSQQPRLVRVPYNDRPSPCATKEPSPLRAGSRPAPTQS